MRRNPAGLALALALGLTHCHAREEAEPRDMPAKRCTQLGTLVLGPEDVNAIRAHLTPPPPASDTLELALDVRASEYSETGRLGALSWPDAIRAYRARVREARGDGHGLRALRTELAEARRGLGESEVICEQSAGEP